MTKKNKKKRWIVFLIIAILLVAGYFGMKNLGSKSTLLLNYTVEDVTKQDMETTVRGSGVVESQNKLDVYSPANIVIEEVYVEDGDEISVGDPIAKIDKDAYLDGEKVILDSISQIDDTIDSMYSTKGSTGIYSNVKATVKIVNVVEDDSIEAVMNKYDSLMVLSVDNNMRIELTVEDADAFEAGDSVFVQIDDDKVEATVTDTDKFESEIKIVFKDDKYEVGQTVDVLDENDKKIGSGDTMINVPMYVQGDAGIARYVYVKANDTVSQGTKLVSVKENGASGQLIELTEQKENLNTQLDELKQGLKDIGLGSDYVLYANGEGIVDGLIITPYMTIAEGIKMLTIQRTHPLEMNVPIDEQDISKVELGQMVELKFEALSGEKYEGEVTRINSLGQSINGVTNYIITVTINETGNILIGMSGNAKILTEKKENVITIPLEAVQLIDDEYYVILGEDANIKTVADHKIITGLNDGAYIEVVEGLNEGDTIAVPKDKGVDFRMGPGK